MKSLPPFLCHLVIFLLVLSVMLSAGCIFPQTTGSSRSPSYDTAATTVAATQPQGANPASSQNTGSANCRSGLTDCSGFCRDLSVDIGNCGACGVTCPSGQTCTKGQCALTCTKGKTVCGDVCADLTADPKNCGSCGIACPSGQVCNSGQCSVACINNLKFCNGYCRDLTADSSNCGSCGIVCPSGTTCQNGQCISNCPSGQTFCNGYCRNLYTDSTNCGSCGVSCAAGSSCQNGQCTAAPQVPSWNGPWTFHTSGDTDMYLTQNGVSVTGSYSGGKGSLSGTTYSSPPVFTGTWRWNNGDNGRIELRMSADGRRFDCSYGYNQGPYTLTCSGYR